MVDKLKFILISNLYPAKDSPGYGSFVKNVCLGLENHGFQMDGKAIIKGRQIRKTNKLIAYLKFYIDIIANFFKKYDFIYIHFPNQAIPILRLLYILKKPSIIVNFHGEDLMYANSGYGNYLGKMTENFCKKYANAIVVPSLYFKSEIINRNIISSDKIIVSPSGGINKDFFWPCTKAQETPLHIGYFGRLEEGKGYFEFLETCNILKNNHRLQAFKATIIGYGSKANEVFKYIKTNNLEDIVTVITGISQTKIGVYYRSLDLFIFSSSRSGESLGLTGIEAMACGIPVIGSDIGGIKSYLINGHNGWIVPQHDVPSIVDRIYHYISLSTVERNELKQNCISTSKNFYSDNVCKNLSEKIHQHINQSLNR